MNKLYRSLFLFVTATVLFFGSASNSYAVNDPQFPTCLNPQGTIIVNYDSGTHGIPGDATAYSGKDTVYQVTSTTVMQCFCSDGGAGIQTNWWKVGSLSEDQIQTLKNLGWIFIPSGAPWGLADTSYMAMNSNYSCSTPGNPGNSGNPTTPAGAPVCNATVPNSPVLLSVKRSGTTAILTWTKIDNASYYSIFYGTAPGTYQYGVPNAGNSTTFTIGALDPNTKYYFSVRAVNDCMPSNPSNEQPRSGFGNVLGLASTGNIATIYVLLAGGIISLATGLLLSLKPKRG